MKVSDKINSASNYGKMAVLIGILILVPLCVIPFYPKDIVYAPSFIIPSASAILLGIILCKVHKCGDTQQNWRTNLRSGSLTVLFAWFFGFLLGAMPFIVSKQLSFVGALFESVSGWTTTGLSVMDVTKTPKIFLFHRSFMQYCGGLGFVMMMVMLIQEKNSMNLFSSEGHPDKLMPNLKKTAQTVCMMFFVFLVIGTIAYRICGMNVFEGIMHTMCALSTGGFSTRLGSIGEYNSLSIEIVTIVLMVIGMTNFAALLLGARRKWRQLFSISEVKFMFVLLIIFIPMVAVLLYVKMDMGIVESLRRSALDVVSALSTTGYSSMSYTDWPQAALAILILLMIVGGGIGSTAGGMKLTRVYILLRMAKENVIKRVSSTRRITAPKYSRAQGKTDITDGLIFDTTAFSVCYVIILLTGTMLLTLTADCSLTEAMFEFSSALGTVGLSIGITNPTTNNATLIVEIIGMIMGRLEIFLVLTGIYSCFNMAEISLLRRGCTSLN